MATSRKNKKNKRFILMMKDNAGTTVKKVASELQVKFTSSAELSTEVKADDVLNTDQGIIFKNLGIAVVDNIDPQQLLHTANLSASKIIHWEEEKTFHTAHKYQNQIDAIKNQINNLNNEVNTLSRLLEELDIKEEEIVKEIINYTWGLKSMNIPQSKLSGKGVDVCILDTGFYAAHPDYTNRNIIGKTFISDELWDYDGDGHGTHCTGTAVGNTSSENGEKYGIAHQANIIIGKVLDDTGSGSTSGIIDAIDWALEKKYKIISMSLASEVTIGEKPSPIFEQIGQRALQQQTLIIAAVGNNSSRPNNLQPVSSPANASKIMAIAAVDTYLKMAKFSNAGINPLYGGKVDLAAPGVNVYSSFSKNARGAKIYKSLNGTSMATPHIAGLAALYLEQNPQLTATQLWKTLEKNAISIPTLATRDIGFGLGSWK